MDSIGNGGTSTIYPDPLRAGYVCKILKRKSTQKGINLEREKEHHKQIYSILQRLNLTYIRVPKVKEGDGYCMERLNRTDMELSNEDLWATIPVDMQATYISEIKVFLNALSKSSIYLKDVEVFRQDDGTIWFIDFGQVNSVASRHLRSAMILPPSVAHSFQIAGKRKTRKLRQRSV